MGTEPKATPMKIVSEIRPNVGPTDEAAKKRREREVQKQRDMRLALSSKTYVLPEILPNLPENPTTQEVCDVLGIKARTTLHNVIHRHRDELFSVGWDPDAGTFTPQAVVMLCLLVRATTSLKAAEVAEAVGARKRVIKFHSNKVPHVRNCQATLRRASEYAERVRDDDPAELWHDIGKLDTYQLQATVVALAAMVPVDQPDLTKWLKDLAPSDRHEGGGTASGLAKLVPAESEAGGVPIGRAGTLEASAAS
ncbi:hypothetical protein I5G72_gp54 [Mycobacterium phage Collard]|uniref:Uncharacterized protein n=1 Tax=Mycobacterium phage Collard TaxID=2301704 RepID=A0A385DXE5_9CAUD|nr:hypothetical protein I5G72_gp54 [Mycobacterium phage Collard]AXQ63219.1 hypothetical protein SEA_COLLARD_45 [Mycobacterium phage Collard]